MFGLNRFHISKINDEAFKGLATALTDKLLVVRTPVASEQIACDNSGGLWQTTSPYLHELQKTFGYKLIDGDTRDHFGIDDRDFENGGDVSHLSTPAAVKKATIQLAKDIAEK